MTELHLFFFGSVWITLLVSLDEHVRVVVVYASVYACVTPGRG